MADLIVSIKQEEIPITNDEIKDTYIKKAILANDLYGFMTIKTFIEYTNYPIDKFLVDNFFDNLNDDIPIYVSDELIDWCGFIGDIKIQKCSFNKILKKFKLKEDYWAYSNSEYIAYYENSMEPSGSIENYPNPNEFIGRNKTKHLVLTIDCFKKVMMMLTTAKADKIRDYYIGLEKLIKIYAKYQIYFQRSKLAINKNEIVELIGKLTIQNNKLDVQNKKLEEIKDELQTTNENFEIQEEQLNTATYERSPRTESDLTHGKFMLLKLNKENYKWSYYAIKTQRVSIDTAFAKAKNRFPEATIVLEIEYQPNAINLFNLVKQTQKSQILKTFSLNELFF